jgi:guanylate kinase
MSKIFFVLGKSCSGKDTIFQSLKENKQLNLKTVVGYTTRPMRVNEKDGVEYFFVDQNKLEELKKAKKVIECRDYNTVYGIWSYFTVDDGQIDLNNGDYLYIGTLESYEQMIDMVKMLWCRYIYRLKQVKDWQGLLTGKEIKVSQSTRSYAEDFWLMRKISQKKK